MKLPLLGEHACRPPTHSTNSTSVTAGPGGGDLELLAGGLAARGACARARRRTTGRCPRSGCPAAAPPARGRARAGSARRSSRARPRPRPGSRCVCEPPITSWKYSGEPVDQEEQDEEPAHADADADAEDRARAGGSDAAVMALNGRRRARALGGPRSAGRSRDARVAAGRSLRALAGAAAGDDRLEVDPRRAACRTPGRRRRARREAQKASATAAGRVAHEQRALQAQGHAFDHPPRARLERRRVGELVLERRRRARPGARRRPRACSTSARNTSSERGERVSARSTSRLITLPEPSQIEASGASR